MLGDGGIQYKKVLSNRKVIGNAKYGMTMDTYSLNYLNHLYETVYKSFSSSGLHSYPNILLPQHSNKVITQFNFNTRSLPIFSTLHSIWYSWSKEKNKIIKIIPSNLAEMFSVISLAYWIMDDGYFDSQCRTKLFYYVHNLSLKQNVSFFNLY
jgi:LAGLIDADG DNA endonuclease family